MTIIQIIRSLKWLRSTTYGCKYVRNRKFNFLAIELSSFAYSICVKITYTVFPPVKSKLLCKDFSFKKGWVDSTLGSLTGQYDWMHIQDVQCRHGSCNFKPGVKKKFSSKAVEWFDSIHSEHIIKWPYCLRTELFLPLIGMSCNVLHEVYRVLHGNFLIDKLSEGPGVTHGKKMLKIKIFEKKNLKKKMSNYF